MRYSLEPSVVDTVRRLAVIVACVCLGALWCAPSATADTVVLKNMRIWRAPDRVRVVMDMNAAAFYRISVLQQPPRVTLDVPGGELRGAVPGPQPGAKLLRRIRVGKAGGVQRLVFDLAYAVKPNVHILRPDEGFNYRLILTLPRDAQTSVAVQPVQPSVTPAPARRHGDIVIAVDAGHGGEDPGAVGGRGLREKDVVLKIARQLARRINAAPGMRAVLTRSGDYYVKLRERVRLARQAEADLFVSIHADAVPRRTARGSSVYVLSLKGATSETARQLAEKENLADFAGGIDLARRDEDVAQTIVELSMESTIKDSLSLGQAVLNELRKIGPLHSDKVEQAGFVVLKSAEVRSILIETAYISNPREEKLLRSRKHQKRLARAVLRGIRNFCTNAGHGCRY